MGMVRDQVRQRAATWLVATGVALILIGTQMHLAEAAAIGRPVATVKVWDIGSWWQGYWDAYRCLFWICK